MAKYSSYVGRALNDLIVSSCYARIGASLITFGFPVSWGSAGFTAGVVTPSGFGIDSPGALKPENSYTTVKMISPMGISSKVPYEEGELVLK